LKCAVLAMRFSMEKSKIMSNIYLDKINAQSTV
jgi:hypothetical protein